MSTETEQQEEEQYEAPVETTDEQETASEDEATETTSEPVTPETEDIPNEEGNDEPMTTTSTPAAKKAAKKAVPKKAAVKAVAKGKSGPNPKTPLAKGKKGAVKAKEVQKKGSDKGVVGNKKGNGTTGAKRGARIGKEGVVYEIAVALAAGSTKDEILAHLVKKFPDRVPEKMRTTIGVQTTRLPKDYDFTMKKVKDEKRGLIYVAPARLPKNVLAGKSKFAESHAA